MNNKDKLKKQFLSFTNKYSKSHLVNFDIYTIEVEGIRIYLLSERQREELLNCMIEFLNKKLGGNKL